MSDSLPGLETLKSSEPAAAAEKRAPLALRVGSPRTASSGLLSLSLCLPLQSLLPEFPFCF